MSNGMTIANGAHVSQAYAARIVKDASRRLARERGLSDKLRPPCRQCYVISQAGIRSSHDNVCDGMDGLKMSPMYSVLISDDCIVLARRVPSMGASSAKMAKVDAFAIEMVRKIA